MATGKSPSGSALPLVAAEAKDGRERPLIKRGRRWLIAVSIIAVLLVFAGWWIDRQLEPQRLTALVLDKAGTSLGLRLAFSGEPDYAFKPEPRLLIPNLQVRSKASGKVFLSAARMEISLPWDTLTGGAPVITRIELDAPVLDLPGLREWQATRPPTPFELPTLTKGLMVRNGLVRDAGLMVSKLALDLPRLKSGEPANVKTSGIFRQGETAIAFDVAITVATAGLDSEFTIAGSGELLQKPKPLPFKLKAAGHYRSDDEAVSVEARSLRLDGTSPLPNLGGALTLRSADTLALDFNGTLQSWAKDWPTLPTPINATTAPMPLAIEYLGASDFSGPLQINLSANAARLQASLRIAELQQWLDASAGSPLPPLDATISAPTLEVEGFTLEGVEIEIRESAPAEDKP